MEEKYNLTWLLCILDVLVLAANSLYDGIGQQTEIIDAKNQKITTTYDPNGNVKTVTDKRHILTYTDEEGKIPNSAPEDIPRVLHKVLPQITKCVYNLP